MNRVLIIDTETTGLDHDTDRVIEVGAILYSIDHATALQSFSSLLRADANPAEHINRIPAAALADGDYDALAWGHVCRMAGQAGAIVAHNAEFDRAWCPGELRVMQWVCSQSDLRWPKQTRPNPSLVALALEHDLGVAYAHRALTDCDLIARLFTRARELGADLQEMLRLGMRPKVLLQAMVSYDDREKAKAAGFRWDGDTRRWLRRMVAEDAAGLGFATREVAQ